MSDNYGFWAALLSAFIIGLIVAEVFQQLVGWR